MEMHRTTSNVEYKTVQWTQIIMRALKETEETNHIIQIPVGTEVAEGLLNMALDQLVEEGDNRALQVEVVKHPVH
jgi:F0F1-type ATP synthase beta subunit